MKPRIEAVLTPALLSQSVITGKIVVVIDVLRSTSTICAALHNGAKEVIPVESIEECLSYKGDGVLLAAERKGIKVEGFRYGNSPTEYSPFVVKGKTLVMTTTNGTQAIKASHEAEMIVAGSFLNLDALSGMLIGQDRDILLLCAGWKGKFNMEDAVCAGAIISRVKSHQLETDATLAALYLYRAAAPDLFGFIKGSSHYQRLAAHGLEMDIRFCLSMNKAPVIPVLREGSLVVLEAADIVKE